MNRYYSNVIIAIVLTLCCHIYGQTPKLWGLTSSGANGYGSLFGIPTGSTGFSNQSNFTGYPGSGPQFLKLTQASNGKLYGTTRLGGASNLGVLFEFDPVTSVYTKLVDFLGTSNGSNPQSSLFLASNGKLYGTTQIGGLNAQGVIFEYDISTSTFTKKIDLATGTGSQPFGSLVEGNNGKLYGVTRIGGTNNQGTLYEYDFGTNTYTVRVNFLAATNGSLPHATPINAANNKLYGTTLLGGVNNVGVIYEYDYNLNIFTKKVDLATATGSQPFASLVQASNGKLYGTANLGGLNGLGVIYEYDYGTNTYTKLIDMSSVNGANPQGGLIQATNGNLFGVTRIGGSANLGALFEFNITGSVYTKRYDFTAATGQFPIGAVMQATNGVLYGVASTGGSNAVGVLFDYNVGTTTFTKRVDFNASNGGQPLGSLVLASNSKMYGLTSTGGVNNAGAIFEYNPATSTYTKSYDLTTANGSNPSGAMVQASNGKLYGMTRIGGLNSIGVIFEFDYSTSTYTKKIDLTVANGNNPYGSLVEANGKLFGLTNVGGTNNLGVLFEYDPVGNTYTKRFDLASGTGSNPYGSLIQASNGKLYGMTRNGGANGVGAIFEYVISTTTYSKVADLSTANGSLPHGSLLQAANGKLYGLTSAGGANGLGALFEFDVTSNTYTKLIDLTAANGQAPLGSLCRGSNGKLYGLTQSGGANALGVIFEFDIAGNTYTKMMDLGSSSGNSPAYTHLIEDCPSLGTPGAISSFSTLCKGTAGSQVFSLTAVANATGYTWVFPAGASVVSGGTTNIVNVDFSAVNVGTFTVEVTCMNTCGTSSQTAKTVTVLTTPTITANSGVICSGNAFTIVASGANTYSYSGGSNIVSPTTTTFYSVSGTDLSGCVSATSAISNVTVNALPLISVNSGSICSGLSFTMVPGGATTYTFSSGSPVVSPTTNTFYSVTGTDGNGCISSVPAVSNVSVIALPVISVNSGTICMGSVFTMVPGGATTYTFSSGSSTVSPPVNTNYSVTGTSSVGCISAAPAISSVTVNPLPAISVSSGSICSGNSYTILASGASTYTYSGGSSVVSPTVTSSYTVVGTSSLGCVSSSFATSSVTVAPLPVLGVNSGTICFGNVFTMLPSGAATYTYSSGSNTVSPATNTFYTVTGTSSLGCVSGAPAISNVTVHALPVISVNSGSICETNSFTMTPSGAFTYTYSSVTNVVSPTITTTYSVSGTSSLGCLSPTFALSSVTVAPRPFISVNSGTICSGNSFTMTGSGASNYTFSSGSNIVSPTTTTFYTVIGSSSLGCASSNTAVSNVTVYALPTLSVNSGSICAGNNFTMIANGATTYTFSSGTNIVSPPTTTFYTVIGTSSMGCISSNTAVSNITVVPRPIITVNSGSICSGMVFTMTPGGAFSYTFSNGTNTVSPVTSTTYSVMGTSSVGCISIAPAISTVIVVPLPNVLISGTNALCYGSTATLVASGAQTYSWDSGATSATVTVTPSTTVTYSVLGVGITGCSKTTAFAINVIPLPTVTAAGGAICPGNSFTISPSGASSYTYSSGSGIVSPVTTSTYSIIGADINGCISPTTTLTVNVVNTLTVTVSGNNTICVGQTANLIANGASTYSWSEGSSTNTVLLTPTITTNFTVVGSSGSCHDTASVLVNVNPLPTLLVSSSASVICLNESAQISVSGASTYSWSTQQIGNTILVTPSITTSYTVSGTDGNLCSNTAIFTQSVSDCVGIPSQHNSGTFASVYPNPNNGTFFIEVNGTTEFAIYDTLGQLIYQSSLTEGKHLMDLNRYTRGIYFVEFKRDNQTKTLKIIRE